MQRTDSAVEAVQEEAARKLVTALADVWSLPSSGSTPSCFTRLEIDDLLGLRDALRLALEVTEVLIECRPLDDLDADD